MNELELSLIMEHSPIFIHKSQRSELNRRPTLYESVALPLSYVGLPESNISNGMIFDKVFLRFYENQDILDTRYYPPF
jgi:hypothetical protein